MLKNELTFIVLDPALHARWLNTLSYLENCGAKLIAECQHPIIVPKELLKHAAEEFRHAFYLKSLADKVSGQPLATYQAKNILGGYAARFYLWRLNSQISKFLKIRCGSNLKNLRIYAYLLVTYAVEVRALKVYQFYQELLSKYKVPISISNVLKEEKHHLQEINLELNQSEAKKWISEILQIEQYLFDQLQKKIRLDIQKQQVGLQRLNHCTQPNFL